MKKRWLWPLAIVIGNAQANPAPDKELIIMTMAAGLVEMANVDGKIDPREEKLLAKEFPLQARSNPVAVFTLDQSDLVKSIKELNLNEKKRRGFFKFLALVALEDGTVVEAEKMLLQSHVKAHDSTLDVDGLLEAAKALQIILRHREISSNLKGIHDAQLKHHSAENEYVSAEPYPPLTSDGKRPWAAEQSGGFLKMGWAPNTPVAGTYWVKTNEPGFKAFGIIDVDGDGVFATYVSTNDEKKPKRRTKIDIH